MSFCKLLKASTRICPSLKLNSFRSVHRFATASYAQTLLNLPETKVTTLENGLKVASEYSDSVTSTVGLWIDAGSRYETDKSNGVAKLFEHLAFKGTSSRSEKDLEKEIGNIGAQFSSYTGREETAFYARCLSSDIPKAVDILSDVIQNCNFDEKNIEQERNILHNELSAVESDLRQVTFDYLHLTAYQGTPLAKSVYGPSENIKNLNKSDLEYYVQNNFLAPRIVLVGCGNFNHDDFVKLAEKHLKNLSFTYTGEIPVLHPCRFTGSEVRARDDWLPFAHVAIAVDTCGYGDHDIYPLMLAKTIIGCWDKTLGSSSATVNNLVQNIYKGKGCHSFEAFHTLYRSTGLWGTYFVVDGLSIGDFMYNLQSEWMKLCTSVKESELAIAKNMLKNNLLLELDNTTQTCAEIGRQLLFTGNRIPFTEVNENIEAVTLQQLKNVCEKYIYDRCPAVAGVGPVEALPDYTRVRSSMYLLRY